MKINQTLAQIKADVSLPSEFKRVLDTLDETEIPIKLITWADKVFKKGRSMKISSERIGECVMAWAEDRHYHHAYIIRVLNANGVREYNEYEGTTRKQGYTPRHFIITFKNIIKGLSGMKEVDVLSVESTRELIIKAQPNLTQFVARMSESQLREYSLQLKYLQALLTELDGKVHEKVRIVNKLST